MYKKLNLFVMSLLFSSSLLAMDFHNNTSYPANIVILEPRFENLPPALKVILVSKESGSVEASFIFEVPAECDTVNLDRSNGKLFLSLCSNGNEIQYYQFPEDSHNLNLIHNYNRR